MKVLRSDLRLSRVSTSPLLSVFRTNQTDPSTGKETPEFCLSISLCLWKNMLQKDRKGWISISQSGRANTDIKGDGNDTNVRDRQNHGKISKTRTLTKNAPHSSKSLQRDPRNVDFTHIDEVIEGDDKDEIAEDSVREVRMSRMSLMSAIKEPSINLEESDDKIAIGDPEVETNNLLFIMSNNNIDNGVQNAKLHSKTYMAMTSIHTKASPKKPTNSQSRMRFVQGELSTERDGEMLMTNTRETRFSSSPFPRDVLCHKWIYF